VSCGYALYIVLFVYGVFEGCQGAVISDLSNLLWALILFLSIVLHLLVMSISGGRVILVV